MQIQIVSLLAFSLLSIGWAAQVSQLSGAYLSIQETAKIETVYDANLDKTTVRLAAVQISGENGKYRSLHMAPSFTYKGTQPGLPAIIDLELRSVVKGRLDTDLYVVFVIDGEKVFLSSNRWAIKRPVRGRTWMGERLVFRMPYQTFLKITEAKTFEIKFDGVSFSVGEKQRQALRELLVPMKPATNPAPHHHRSFS